MLMNLLCIIWSYYDWCILVSTRCKLGICHSVIFTCWNRFHVFKHLKMYDIRFIIYPKGKPSTLFWGILCTSYSFNSYTWVHIGKCVRHTEFIQIFNTQYSSTICYTYAYLFMNISLISLVSLIYWCQQKVINFWKFTIRHVTETIL